MLYKKFQYSMVFCLSVIICMILVSSSFNAQIQMINDHENADATLEDLDFTHTVFAEECSATWCGWCPFVIDWLHNIWEDEDYDWYYVTLVDDKNTYADQRISELGVTGFPTVVYDGGYTSIVGATNQQDHEDAIIDCGNRGDVANVDLSLTAYWLGNGEIEVTAEITNNEASTYFGHLHVYVTEINSRWYNSGTQYHFAMINNYAINQDVNVPSGETESITQTWSGYTDITMDNIKVIGSVFDQTTDYTDETAGTNPIPQDVDPVANFTYSPESPDTNQPIQFIDSSSDPDGTIASWYWTFGDGDTSIQQNPTHTYSDDGTYPVSLLVTDNDGNTDEILKDVQVSNIGPSSGFTYAPVDPTDADTISFTDESTDSDGSIISWFWDFGDGSTSSSQHPSYMYATEGDYIVSLTVTDDDASQDTSTQQITVLNYGPNADFSIDPENPSTDDTIQFTDESFDTSGDTIDSWYWEFGDGSTSTSQNPVHSYAENGSYQVNLTVTNSTSRASHTYSRIIYVGMINVDYSLMIGWNLITLPVETSWWASDLAANVTGCNSLSGWDADAQTYDTYIVGVPESDFVIEDGYGYFVDVNQDSSLSLIGSPILQVEIPLEVGWNLLGWFHEHDTTASSLSENISGCSGVSIWDAPNQTYNTYIIGVPESDYTISQGMGMFVDVTTDSIWHGEG